MTTEIKVPALGESVSEATVAKWMKAPGDAVAVDEPLVELETDKVTVEVPSPVAGVLTEIIAAEGSDVAVGAVLAIIGEAAGATAAKPAEQPAPAASPAPAATPPAPSQPAASGGGEVIALLSPAVRKLIEENRLDPAKISASGKDGRVTKGDVLAYIATQGSGPAPAGEAAEPRPAQPKPRDAVVAFPTPSPAPVAATGARPVAAG